MPGKKTLASKRALLLKLSRALGKSKAKRAAKRKTNKTTAAKKKAPAARRSFFARFF